MAPAADGVRLVALPGELRSAPPLAAGSSEVYGLARRAEGHFAAPQDVEWTLRRGELFALQSRPITTLAGAAGDGRAEYLSLRRSFENLERLRRRIEDEDLPALTAAAERLAAVALDGLGDAQLLEAARERKAEHDRAVDVYLADFVPFAHGVRLFGAAYNDTLRPEDPTSSPTCSRPRRCSACGATRRWSGWRRPWRAARKRPRRGRRTPSSPSSARPATCAAAARSALARRLAAREPAAQGPAAGASLGAAGHAGPGAAPRAQPAPPAAPAFARPARRAAAERARLFVDAHPAAERERAAALLELARASWRLRDDDNLYLGRLERLLTAALEELERRGLPVEDAFRPRAVTLPSPLAPAPVPAPAPAPVPTGAPVLEPAGRRTPAMASAPRPGRFVGQPAGPGLPSAPPGWSEDARTSRPSSPARSSSATRSSRR